MTSQNRIDVLKKVLAYDKVGGRNIRVELSDWETDFIASMSDKFTKYGEADVTVSDKQFAVLERILKKYEDG